MYKFKISEAEDSLRKYLSEHPQSSDAKKALDGDPVAMLSIYEKLCGDSEFEEGAGYDASMIIFEAVTQKHTPAMIRMAEMEMCQGDEYWPEGLDLLYEAAQLGDGRAKVQLSNDWYNCAEEWSDAEYQEENGLNKYQEYSLGFYYLRGIGVCADERKARAYLLKSSTHGCDEAKKLLAELDSNEFEQR